MTNITLAIDDEILEKVRVYAAEYKTTVNAIVCKHLEKLVGENDKHSEARRNLLRLAETSRGRLASDNGWNREELYDRPVLRGHKRPNLRGEDEK